MRHLGQILNVKWWDFISNADILTRANLPSMYELPIQRNLRWVGRIHRMDDSRLPKQIMHSQLEEGLRDIGRPRLRFKDTVKRNLKDKNFPVGSWQSLSRNRCQWRDMVEWMNEKLHHVISWHRRGLNDVISINNKCNTCRWIIAVYRFSVIFSIHF